MASDAKEQSKGTSKGKGAGTPLPGPYIEEVSSGTKPIEGVGTAIAALVVVGVLILIVLRARSARKDRGRTDGGEVDIAVRPIEGVGTATAG